MLGALGLLLGGRADMRVVRDSSRKSVIEAVADISDAAGIDAVFEENGLDKAADSMCILRRELLPGGRSRAFVNDTPVTLQVLKAVSLRLIDIHSQHQNLLLADSAYQLSVVDSLADNAELRARYSEAYAAYRRALKAYTDMRDLLLRSASDAEYLKFQLEQLDEMHLEPGEQATLEQERDMMANATSIKQHLQGALGPLADDTVNAISALAEAAVHCRALGDMLEDAEALAARLDSARIEVQDVAENLSELDSRVQADPALLDANEERHGKL